MPVILDIDMPEHGWECPCLDHICGWCQAIKNEDVLCGGEIPRKCPLKEVKNARA